MLDEQDDAPPPGWPLQREPLVRWGYRLENGRIRRRLKINLIPPAYRVRPSRTGGLIVQLAKPFKRRRKKK